jgi:ATP-dependent Clp protease ATP-binding subunit ClpB
VIFNSLSADDLAKIVRIQLDKLQGRLSDRRIIIELSDAAIDWLVRHGIDPLYGARPLRRLIQSAIGDELARGILSGKINDGSHVSIGVDAKASELRFETSLPANSPDAAKST